VVRFRYLAIYLILAAVTYRTLTASYDESVPLNPVVYIYLAAYAALLVSEPLLTRRLRWFPWVYLIAQTGLVVAMLFTAPQLDFLPMLFLPLSFQAVMIFKRRAGFVWIAAFCLAMIYPVMLGWDWEPGGLVVVLAYTAANFLMGSTAHWSQRVERARQENQRLLAELQVAYRQLQDYAAQVEEHAAAQERSRLAQELHDSVTQTIFSMNLTVQAAQMLIAQNPARVAGQLDRLQELARGAVGEIQVLIGQLQPHNLAQEGLPAALRRLAAERWRRDGLQVEVQVTGEKTLPEPLAIGLYRIAQEALNNVAKHAGTCQASLLLNLAAHPASLEIADDGQGFEPDKVVRDLNHIGLSGMAERARELGWRLEIDSEPGRGTRIHAEELLA
jgi:signal transduction histidine kinase